MNSRFPFLISLLVSVVTIVSAQPIDPGFKEQLLTANLRLPNGIAFDKNGTGYIWEMEGLVKILDTTDQILETPFIDITEEVAKWLDNGLLGFTLHPEFPNIPYVYLLYSVDLHHYEFSGTSNYDPGKTIKKTATFGRITRFSADPTTDYKTIIPESRKVLLGHTPETGFPILFDSHGVGSLVYCSDGSLLASCGDAASSIDLDVGSNATSYYQQGIERGIITPEQNVGAFKAQMLSTLAGKIIRIDPDSGSGLPSNPFYNVDDPDDKQSKIWVLGLRNGFRFIVKPETGGHFAHEGQPGKLLIGDVGNNSWEELNMVKDGGANLGWPIYEGFFKSTYADEKIYNKEAFNPLSGQDGCPSFIDFNNLIIEDNLEHNIVNSNPCQIELELPPSVITHLHHRPVLSYRNQEKDSLPIAFIPDFNESNEAIARDINELGLEAFEGTANVGGVFYNESQFPSNYFGKYFLLDFSGWIKVLDFDEEEQLVSIDDFYKGGDKLVNINVNPRNGALYLVSTNGSIQKISYGGNLPPKINIATSTLYGPSPLIVEFDASMSEDESENLTFYWDFGDGEKASSSTTNHTFYSENNERKNFTVNLKVTDSEGAISSTHLMVSVNNSPPVVNILTPIHNTKYPNDFTHLVRLEGEAFDPEDGNENLTFEWETYLHHETHFHEDQIFDEKVAYLITNPINCNEDLYWYRAKLKVSDQHGLYSEEEIEVFPNCFPEERIEAYLRTSVEGEGVILDAEIENLQLASIIEIQRSADDAVYEPIAEVRVLLLSNLENFSFIDLHPINGKINYRLKFILENGDWFYSNTSKIFYPASEVPLIYPNPSQGTFKIYLDKAFSEQVDVTIYDFAGRMVLSNSYDAIIDRPFHGSLDANGIPEGIYFFNIKVGGKLHEGKLIILK